MMKRAETTEVLNDLLTRVCDAEQGYEQAAKQTSTSPRLRSFFVRENRIRRQIAYELKEMIANYGGEPDQSASLVSKTHQIWVVMRDFFPGCDEDALLEECMRGEEVALQEYDEAMSHEELPADVRQLLARQWFEIAVDVKPIPIKEAASVLMAG